jgi:hypothetical protein
MKEFIILLIFECLYREITMKLYKKEREILSTHPPEEQWGGLVKQE